MNETRKLKDAVLSYGGGYSSSWSPGGEGDTKGASSNHGGEVSRLGGHQNDAGEFGRAASQYIGKSVTPVATSSVSDAEPDKPHIFEDGKCKYCGLKWSVQASNSTKNCPKRK